MKLRRVVQGEELSLFQGEEKVLSIRETQQGNAFTIQLEGSLKSDTVHELQDELGSMSVLGLDLRVDMEKVKYMSSACADVFLKLQLDMDSRGKGSLTLLHVPAEILRELSSTGMAELLMIEQ